MEIRLQKLIADRGVCSRRKAEKLILEGRVTVEGQIVNELGFKVDAELVEIKIDGKNIPEALPAKTLMLNKPIGYLSTCLPSREKGKSILSLLPKDRRYFPVGRLDKDSSGLLIVTDDGYLSHKLAHPSNDTRKVYLVEVDSILSKSDLDKLVKGVYISDGLAKALEVKKISESSLYLTLSEGRNRQIRKMMEALDYKVISLKRVQIGNLCMDKLPEGKWRELSAKEIELLLNH